MDGKKRKKNISKWSGRPDFYRKILKSLQQYGVGVFSKVIQGYKGVICPLDWFHFHYFLLFFTNIGMSCSYNNFGHHTGFNASVRPTFSKIVADFNNMAGIRFVMLFEIANGYE